MARHRFRPKTRSEHTRHAMARMGRDPHELLLECLQALNLPLDLRTALAGECLSIGYVVHSPSVSPSYVRRPDQANTKKAANETSHTQLVIICKSQYDGAQVIHAFCVRRLDQIAITLCADKPMVQPKGSAIASLHHEQRKYSLHFHLHCKGRRSCSFLIPLVCV